MKERVSDGKSGKPNTWSMQESTEVYKLVSDCRIISRKKNKRGKKKNKMLINEFTYVNVFWVSTLNDLRRYKTFDR